MSIGNLDPRTFEAAYDAVVRAHYVRLVSFAYRIVRSWDIAEDAVQEVLFRIWDRRPAVDFTDPLPYLYQAVKREAVVALRRQERRREDDVADADSLGAADIEDTELRDAVERAIAALPDRCRLIFTMSREQDLTYQEIARLLGISVKTVETQMGRALKTLRRLLAAHLSIFLAIF